MLTMEIFLLMLIIAVGTARAVNINVDCSQATDLCEYGSRMKSEMEKWYPILASKMNSPTFYEVAEISLTFDPNYNGVAYASGTRIVGAVQYYRNIKNDIGSMIHEMIHVIQEYKNYDPSWLIEGIADYWRYYHYEPNRKPGKPSSSNSYKQGYGIAAYFLNYINTSYYFSNGKTMIYYLNKDLREGNYNDSIFPRLLNKNLDQLWNDMLAHG